MAGICQVVTHLIPGTKGVLYKRSYQVFRISTRSVYLGYANEREKSCLGRQNTVTALIAGTETKNTDLSSTVLKKNEYVVINDLPSS